MGSTHSKAMLWAQLTRPKQQTSYYMNKNDQTTSNLQQISTGSPTLITTDIMEQDEQTTNRPHEKVKQHLPIWKELPVSFHKPKNGCIVFDTKGELETISKMDCQPKCQGTFRDINFLSWKPNH